MKTFDEYMNLNEGSLMTASQATQKSSVKAFDAWRLNFIANINVDGIGEINVISHQILNKDIIPNEILKKGYKKNKLEIDENPTNLYTVYYNNQLIFEQAFNEYGVGIEQYDDWEPSTTDNLFKFPNVDAETFLEQVLMSKEENNKINEVYAKKWSTKSNSNPMVVNFVNS